jgi:hypothetical protein
MIGRGIALSPPDAVPAQLIMQSTLYSPGCPKMFPYRWIKPLVGAPVKTGVNT